MLSINVHNPVSFYSQFVKCQTGDFVSVQIMDKDKSDISIFLHDLETARAFAAVASQALQLARKIFKETI